jgi:hypothetical protein
MFNVPVPGEDWRRKVIERGRRTSIMVMAVMCG